MVYAVDVSWHLRVILKEYFANYLGEPQFEPIRAMGFDPYGKPRSDRLLTVIGQEPGNDRRSRRRINYALFLSFYQRVRGHPGFNYTPEHLSKGPTE